MLLQLLPQYLLLLLKLLLLRMRMLLRSRFVLFLLQRWWWRLQYRAAPSERLDVAIAMKIRRTPIIRICIRIRIRIRIRSLPVVMEIGRAHV